ncbi:GTP-binding protein hflX [Enterobacter asburiae]|uniref:GTP-binding protein hflX n=1 Tax=Enterobacter asburiae TaxID=61645 RepID=A0A376FJC2_ENTAS|nr:GTP-binding protein hflX [Enterobacter asburiae]
MFDRYDAGEQAVLVHIYFSQDKDMEDLQEFESLVSSAGVEAMQVITGSRKAPHPKYFVGEGKAVEIADAVKATGASVVLFDHALSPAQERNLEALCECRVIDRTGLILDIFAQRARTHEGKLQVELAQLRHLATRLVRGWTHLERQKGGIGLRGPGETQLETRPSFAAWPNYPDPFTSGTCRETARTGASGANQSRYPDGVAGGLYQRR